MSTEVERDGVLLLDDALRDAAVDADAPAPAPKRRRGLASFVGPFLVFVVFIAFWEYMHRDGMERILDKRAFLVPSPITVLDKSFTNRIVREQIIGALGWTSYAALAGLLITIVLGMTMAVLMAQAQWIERSFYPYLVALQAMPVLAIVPLINSVFGSGMGSRIFVCVMISIFPIVTNTLFGLTSADPGQHDLFTLRRSSRATRLWKLQFPAAMPAIFTGFRISAGLSVIGAVVGEQFFQQGEKPGLGILMERFRQKVRFPELYGCLLMIAILGIAVFLFFGLLSRLVVGHWHETTRRSR